MRLGRSAVVGKWAEHWIARCTEEDVSAEIVEVAYSSQLA